MNKEELNQEILMYIYKQYTKGKNTKLIKFDLEFISECAKVASFSVKNSSESDYVKFIISVPNKYIYNTNSRGKRTVMNLNINKYFNSLSIPKKYYPIANNILILLHEMGYTMFMYNLCKNEKTISRIPRISPMIDDITTHTKYLLYYMDKHKIDNYRNSYEECIADRFSYREFPIIWKSIEKKFLFDNVKA